MKAKSIKTVEVKEIGAINLSKVEAISGQFEVFIPIAHTNKEMDELINNLYKDFQLKHPEVKENDTNVDVRVRYSTEQYYKDVDSDFALDIYIWQDSNEDVVEEYDDIPLYLGEEGTRTVKKLIWDALGKMLLNI